jgi:hypothetical protein
MDGKKLKKKYPVSLSLLFPFLSLPLQVWFCWMNSWDEARSSCDSPQEGTFVHSFAEQYFSHPHSHTASAEDDEEDWGLGDEEDEGGSGTGEGGLTLQGISSRGRIVRSRWNSRRARR